MRPWVSRRGALDRRVLTEAIGEFGHLKMRVNFKGDALEFAVLFQGADEFSQVGVCHLVVWVGTLLL